MIKVCLAIVQLTASLGTGFSGLLDTRVELWTESQPTKVKGGGLLLKAKAIILVKSVSAGRREHSGSFSFLEFLVLS